jgi:signal transduction histidine kinase
MGIGLTITDRAVRLHGGQVSAKNAPDGGLIVEISLPAVRA